MAERKRRKPAKKRPSKNEFEEIIELKLNKEPVISQDDILNFKIDFGLYNKQVEKLLEEEKKKTPQKKQGKKRWLKRNRSVGRKQKINVKKSTSTLHNTSKNLALGVTSTE